MGFWEGFAKYIGIQGVLAVILVGVYAGAIFSGVSLPQGFTELMSLVLGFFFAKNGPNIVGAVKRPK